MPILSRRLVAALAAVTAISAALSARAQSPAPPTLPPLTVDDAVRAAVADNPSLRAASRDITAAASGVRAARATANPETAFAPGLTSAAGSDTELLVQQPLEVNGTRSARTGVAGARLSSTQAAAVVTLRETVFATIAAYYELARARELQALAKDVLQSTEEFDRITRRQVDVGSRPGVDRTQTGIEVARARQQLVLADAQVMSAESTLNTSMGRPPAEPIGPLTPLTPPTSQADDPDEEAIVRQALAARAEIAIDEAERDAFRQEARLARAEGRPDLVPQFRAGSVTRGVSDAGIGIGISLPLLDLGSRRHRVRQSEEAARAQEDRISARRNQVRQEVRQAIVRVGAADAVLKEYPQGVLEQAKRLLDAARIGFQSGQTGILAVLEAQRTYRTVQTEYTGALVDRALALAELERATGAFPAERLPLVAAPSAIGERTR